MTTPDKLPKLHVITDPYCGWCYAAAPLLDAVTQDLPELTIELHCGGMLTDGNTKQVTPDFRDFVMMHNERIEKMTGQPFSKAYRDGLLCDNTVTLDSTLPTAAILAAQEMAGKGFAMLHAQQTAQYTDGLNIGQLNILQSLAEKIGINRDEFTEAYEEALELDVQSHIEQSRGLLQHLGGRGFPTAALEVADKHWQTVELGAFLGQTQKWIDFLNVVLAEQTEKHSTEPTTPLCDLDGNCAS